MRDIQRDYRDAMVQEYESLVRAGRTVDAKHVQRELRVQFGHSVGGEDAPPPEPERADEPRPPEDTAEQKPVRRGPGRPRKATEATPSEKK